MESQPQNPEFRNNPENFHPCMTELSHIKKDSVVIQGLFLADFIVVIRLYSQCQKVSFFPNFQRKIPNFKS